MTTHILNKANLEDVLRDPPTPAKAPGERAPAVPVVTAEPKLAREESLYRTILRCSLQTPRR